MKKKQEISKQEPVKSGFLIPFTERHKAVVMLEMLHIAHDGLTNPITQMFGQKMMPEFEKTMLAIFKEMRDKFHEQGWCEDKECKHYKSSGGVPPEEEPPTLMA